ncbi:MAG TPA: sigma-70 family RNA polymerase sigma factor [Nitrospirota bacterium]|nr:sigma-70 family RNA polymerase sigma factor [Nitrospirota bacterium]
MDEDIDLINRCGAGEREAFDELVRKYQKPLYFMLYRMVSNHDDAADILQKAFVKAFTGLARFEQRSSFKTWLYQIAINLAKNLYRDRSKAQHVPIDDVVIRKDPKTLEALIDEESKQILRCAYSRLPEKQRLTLMLRVQEERKFEEIAGIMKCSIGTAKANYHHAVQKLKGMLGEEKTGESGVRSRESGDPGNEVQ